MTDGRNGAILTAARSLRGFGAGALSVVLAPELVAAGYSGLAIGLLLGAAMGASALWAIVIPGRSRRLGARPLFVGAALAMAAGGTLLWVDLAAAPLLLFAVALGGIVAGGSDISPLGALEQGALAAAAGPGERTPRFAAYNFAGYLANAAGALAAGPLGSIGGPTGALPSSPRDAALLLYGLLGLILVPVYLGLTAPSAGSTPPGESRALSPTSRGPILQLSALFAVDAVGGGMIANALVSLFLVLRFHAGLGTIGLILGAASLASAGSLLAAVPLARRYGLVNTMVFTHLPSSALLVLFAATPALGLAALVWVARATLSQMDVPTRQSYTQAIVPPSEGAAAAGYTTAARSAQAVGSPITGAFLGAGAPWLGVPFAVAGSIKVLYDLALYRRFRARLPPEEVRVPD